MESMQQLFPGQNWGSYLVRSYPEPPLRYEEGSGPSTPEPNPSPLHQQWGPFYGRVDATGSVPLHYFQTTPAPAPFPMPVPTTSSVTEPMFAMSTSSLPLEAPQSYLESTACSPLFHIPHNSSFACPFTGPKTLPPWSQFAVYNLPQYELGSPESAPGMITSSYGQDFTRTPTPLSSSTSRTGSRESSVWDSCSTTRTSLSSLSDGTSHVSDLGTGHKGNMMAGQIFSSRASSRPGPIDAEENIWEVDMLLGKWTRGKTTWYLVKWKGFDNNHNSWVKHRNICDELVDEFEASYQGNDFAIERLLWKRTRRGGTEYLVEWKGRVGDDSWEKEADISRARIIEFEGGK